MSDEINKDTVDYRDPTPFDDTKLNSVSEISKGIRHKLYGKDTREAIAQQGEALVKLMQETGGNQAAEVIAARGNHALLSMREDAQDNAITTAQSTANVAQSTANGKFDTNQAESYLKSITALPETFANLAAIKAKYPSGKNGLMVAADNGHKYIWANNVWADAGVYQSVGIADGTVTLPKLNVPFVSKYDNVIFDYTTNFQAETIISSVNGIDFSGNVPIDKEIYYLLIDYTPKELVNGIWDIGFKTASVGWDGTKTEAITTRVTHTTLTGESYQKTIEVNMTNYTSSNFNLSITPFNSVLTYAVTINKVFLVKKNFVADIEKMEASFAYYEHSKNLPVLSIPWSSETVNYIADQEKTEIALFGDSMINAGGSMGTLIAEETSLITHELSVGGENTITTMGRIGSSPWIVQPFTIPSDTTQVPVTIKSEWSNTALNPYLTSYGNYIDVIISGIEGKLYGLNNDTTRDSFAFARKTAGTAIEINKPKAIIIKAMTEKISRAIHVVWMGTNGGYADYQDLIEQYEQVANHLNANGAKNYLFFGFYMLNHLSLTDMISYTTHMKKKFGRHFIDVRDYFINYAMQDCGITPTAGDTTAIANGQVPPSLLGDGVHYTTVAKTALMQNVVFPRLKELHVY